MLSEFNMFKYLKITENKMKLLIKVNKNETNFRNKKIKTFIIKTM